MGRQLRGRAAGRAAHLRRRRRPRCVAAGCCIRFSPRVVSLPPLFIYTFIPTYCPFLPPSHPTHSTHPLDARVFDPSAGGRAALALRGHLDFSFAAAWHPGGLLVATGNQDRTTRLYDLRAPARPLALLRARIGAVRSLRFSPDGALLAAAEPADYVAVHAAGAAGDWGVAQAVDLFGEVAGVSWVGGIGELGRILNQIK
jgi:hypothetical protein